MAITPTATLASVVALCLAVAVTNYAGWAVLNSPISAPDVPARVAGLSFTPFQRMDDPAKLRFPSNADIQADLDNARRLTDRVRTYTSAQFPDLPSLAAQSKLRVTAGVWLTGKEASDTLEIRAAVRTANQFANVERLIVGNETILKKVLTPEQLTLYLRQVRYLTTKPISTAEPWNIWLAHPELAKEVDFITIHLLPYWEGIAIDNAVGHALYQVQTIQKRFPGKTIVIGEVGWPSSGEQIAKAKASPGNQAKFIREFLAMAPQLDYFLMEASDQPWKVREEGQAGGYWGLTDAKRQPKFAFSGQIEQNPYWRISAVISSLVGFVLLLTSLLRMPGLRPVAKLVFAVTAQAIVIAAVTLVMQPMTHYLYATDWVAMAIFVPTLCVMALILLSHAFEFVELFWKGSLRRQYGPRPVVVGSAAPKVSVHLACCNESPNMVIATIESLRSLDYANFEVLVVYNNTTDVALWQPVQTYMQGLPPQFRFFHLPQWPGYKAGALNFALQHTAADAQVIAVVDADYIVQPDWLSSLVGHFDDPQVGVVQAPQAHREWGAQVFRRMMNWEYDGFFRIGMHHRNERNAIVQHGTMTMIKARALREHGAWSEWCVCEDTELGLRLLRHGYTTVYVDKAWGHGLTPDSFAAFKKQRLRWAQGGMQILKAHARALLSRETPASSSLVSLTVGQKYHFLAGWLPWIADALHLVFALAALVWTVGVLVFPQWITLPTMLFMLPLATFVLAKLIVGPLLYWRRVPCKCSDIVGASIAGMGVSHGIARGVLAGLFRSDARFEVTTKGQVVQNDPSRPKGVWTAVREEALLFAALMACAAVFAYFLPPHPHGIEAYKWLWICMLLLQAMPYAAALLCTALSLRPAIPSVQHRPLAILPGN